MKKLLLLAVGIMLSTGIFAQKGQTAAGLNLSYGTEIKNIGIGAKGQYGITDKIRLEASFDYFLEKDEMKMWDININAHYLFNLSEKWKIYPLVGITYTHWKYNSTFIYDWDDLWDYDWYDWDVYEDEDEDTSESEGKFGINVGCGWQYEINDKFALTAEIKYQLISDFNQFVVGIGAVYKF